MFIAWTPHAWEDYLEWQKTDKIILKRIHSLLKDITRTPFDGRGKPETLRHNLAGYWSRRIDKTHRLVYSYDSKADTLTVVQCKFHY